MTGVIDRIAELQSAGHRLQQIGIEPASHLLPPDIGDHGALGIEALFQTGERLGGNCREGGADPFSGPAESGGQRKRVVQRPGYIVLIEQCGVAIVLGALGAGG